HIDDTDPADPELVFSQDGVEVGRIPASALLTGVVNTGELVGKQLHFKDRTGTVVINIDLSPVLDVKADKTVTISTGTGLSGGGDLSANRTVSLDTTYTDGRYQRSLTAGDNIDISSSRVISAIDTIYTAGNGLTLSGTSFTLPVSVTGSGSFVKSITQSTGGISVVLDTPPNTNTTYSNMTLAELNAGTATTARSISAKTLTDWADGKYALRTRTITGTGSLTGGGNLTANRTLDLTSTAKSDIAKGVTAHGRGDFREFGLGTTLPNDTWDLLDSTLETRFMSATDHNIPGISSSLNLYGIKLMRSATYGLAFGGINNRFFGKMLWGGDQQNFVEFWTNDNFNPSNYYTKNQSLNQFVTLNGVQTIAKTKTFTSSPVVPDGTIGSHAASMQNVAMEGASVKQWVNQQGFLKSADVNIMQGSASMLNTGTNDVGVTWGAKTLVDWLNEKANATGTVSNSLVRRDGTKINTAGGFFETSDRRLKTSIKDMGDTLKKVLNVPTVSYKMNKQDSIGTIAQDVQEIFPELVNTDEDGILSVNYAKLSIVAIKAIKELKEELNEVKRTINE